MKISSSNAELVEVARGLNRDAQSCVNELSRRNPLLTDGNLSDMKDHLQRIFLPQFAERWKEAGRITKKFLKSSGGWLVRDFTVDTEPAATVSTEAQPTSKETRPGPGRPMKSFEDCGPRAKRYKIDEFQRSHCESLLKAATACDGRLESGRQTQSRSSFCVNFGLSAL